MAAALAYGLGRTADEALILVFDLGGGTFDCSLVEAFEGCLEARRTPCDSDPSFKSMPLTWPFIELPAPLSTIKQESHT